MEKEQYDAIIIGAGQSGVPLSVALTEAGWSVALVERAHVGGTCVNVGCTPTKAMVASAHAAYQARRGEDYGVRVGEVRVDMEKVRARKRKIVEDVRKGVRQYVLDAGVELIDGEGRFVGPREVEVRLEEGARRLAAERIFIDTGQRPRIPKVEGLEEVEYFDSTSIMELGEVPEHLIVIGGGYVGLEFAQIFRRFGSQVTVVQRGEQLLSHEDGDVAEAVARILEDEGIEVWLEAEADRVSGKDDGRVELTVRTPDGTRSVKGTHLLIAAGRVPNTEALNLESAGVRTTKRGYVDVNSKLETNVPGVYAMGDVKGGPAFTHISYDDFRILRTNLLDGGEATIEGRQVPYTVFIDPALGRIGLTEKAAREQGYAVRAVTLPMSRVSRAVEMGRTRGFMKAVVDEETDRVLGVAILGVEGGEIATVAQIAMLAEFPYTVLRDLTFSHPLLSEGYNNLFMQLPRTGLT